MKYIDDKGEVGKLRTARGKKTGSRHTKVRLASDEMTRTWRYLVVQKTWTTECRNLQLA